MLDCESRCYLAMIHDDLFLCIIQDALPPSSSHHQDYYMFSGGCLVATAAGWVRTQRYSYGFVGGPSLLMILMIILYDDN